MQHPLARRQIASATQQAEDARTLLIRHLQVLEQWPVEAGTLQIINYRPSSGTTLLDFEIIRPPATWKSDHVLTIVDETETFIPLEWNLQTSNSIYDSLRVQLVADIEAETVSTWRWSYGEGSAGVYTEPPLLSWPPFKLPCWAATSKQGSLSDSSTTSKGFTAA